jgi:hypothetical protein
MVVSAIRISFTKGHEGGADWNGKLLSGLSARVNATFENTRPFPSINVAVAEMTVM